MGKRIVNWLTYNVILGLLPFVSSIFLQLLAGVPFHQTLGHSPELLFFSLMVCSVTLGDLNNLKVHKSVTYSLFSSLALLGTVVSALLYGSFLQDGRLNSSGSDFQVTVVTMSVWMSIFFFCFTTLIQIAIAREEANQ